jgi:hypothetical protein
MGLCLVSSTVILKNSLICEYVGVLQVKINPDDEVVYLEEDLTLSNMVLISSEKFSNEARLISGASKPRLANCMM